MPVIRNYFIISLIVTGLFLTGCSGPELEKAQSRRKVTLKGQFLTENPDVINFPIRVILAIDCSGSMAGSDPVPEGAQYPSRIEAAREFIETYHEYESIKFDIILWNSHIEGTTGGFTREIDDLNRVLNNYDNTTATNYSNAIQSAESHFTTEIISMEQDNSQSANIARMKCIVLFFSDGLPDPGDAYAYAEITRSTTAIRDNLLALGVASFNFHTFFLSALFDPASADYQTATNLMTNMANIGHGVFVEFESASSIDFINVVDMRLTPEYKMKFIIAFNNNVRPGAELLMVDSDGDGLADSEEDINGNGIVDVDAASGIPVETNPRLRDSDGDGLSDYAERKLSTINDAFDPNDASDSRCPEGAETLDRDRDGLCDCEEVIKGTNYYNPDTDSDGIPDGVEFYMGSNPLEAQYAADTDFDGVADWLEVQRHTNIGINDDKIRRRYSYYYDIADQGLVILNQGTEHESRRRRISFNISNIDIMNTLAANGRDKGDNLIRFFIAEVPEDMPNAQPRYRVADIIVNINSNDSRDIEIDSFEAL